MAEGRGDSAGGVSVPDRHTVGGQCFGRCPCQRTKKQHNILMRAASVNQCRTNLLTQADALGLLREHRGWSYVEMDLCKESKVMVKWPWYLKRHQEIVLPSNANFTKPECRDTNNVDVVNLGLGLLSVGFPVGYQLPLSCCYWSFQTSKASLSFPNTMWKSPQQNKDLDLRRL